MKAQNNERKASVTSPAATAKRQAQLAWFSSIQVVESRISSYKKHFYTLLFKEAYGVSTPERAVFFHI